METWWQHFKRDQPKDNNEQETSRAPVEPDVTLGSLRTPRTEKRAGEPKDKKGENIEPQTHGQTPREHSPKEEIEIIAKDENSKKKREHLVKLLEETLNKKDWWDSDPTEGDSVKRSAFKELWKERLREIKYYTQGSDFDDVKAKTDKGEPAPWRTNTNWNKTKKEYRDAWRHLRIWADRRKIWNENDEREFIKETGGRAWTRRETAKETARSVGLNIAVAGLYGIGYALIAPWKAFELGLKYASKVTDDEAYTKGMMEKMFRKKREKTKGKEIKEDWNKAKEYAVKKNVKEMEQNYLLEIKNQITDEKIEHILASPEYQTSTGEDRIRLDKEIDVIRSGLYPKAWRRMRTHWIKEKMWNQEDEKKFRNELGYTPETKIEDVRKDFLTRSEWNELKSLRGERRKKEASQEKQEKDSNKYKELDQDIKELSINIKEIMDKSEERLKNGAWPFDDEGKEKGRRQRRFYEDSVADTEDEEEEED